MHASKKNLEHAGRSVPRHPGEYLRRFRCLKRMFFGGPPSYRTSGGGPGCLGCEKKNNVVFVDFLLYGCQPKKYGKTPKSSILIGFSIINYKPSILGYPNFWKHPYSSSPQFDGKMEKCLEIPKTSSYFRFGSFSTEPKDSWEKRSCFSMDFLVLFIFCWRFHLPSFI